MAEFTRIQGVNGETVISKDGFVIEAVIPGGGGIDPDALAAMIVTVYGASERVGAELKLGNPDNGLLLHFVTDSSKISPLIRQHCEHCLTQTL